jgi:glutamine kinase
MILQTNFKNQTHVFGSKSHTLKFLQKKIKNSKIEPIYDFTVDEWTENPKLILKNISIKFDSKIIIRSSALGEDSLESSQAGNFQSVLNIKPSSQNSVKNAIDSVIKSYGNVDYVSKNNQILIQKQSENISVSGVVFTRTPENASPYYVINYDESCSTVGVTSGIVGNVIKIFRNTDIKQLPKPWKKLFKSVKEIEDILNLDKLDIEFGINKNGQVIIFQVRPITFIMKIPVNQNDKKINSLILKNKKKFQKLNKSTKLFGKRAIFSDMSDWNPAEIIGNNPNVFDYSLYDFLIMKKSWYQGRVNIGYHDIKSTPLMVKFGNKPYVDVRASFNSFLPSNLPSSIKTKLLKYYLEKLENFPYLHDKVEFDILFSCYDLSMDSRLNELKKSGFSSKEIHILKSSLIQFTNSIINNFNSISSKSQNSILTLTSKREESLSKVKSTSSHTNILEIVEIVLNDCRTYGAIPFSSMARIAFISTILLKSLQKNDHISNEFFDSFLNSISSPLSEIQNDLNSYKKDKLTKTEFLKKYGHLRPGTYDITATRYDQQQQFLDNMKMFVSKKKDKRISEPKNLTSLFQKHELHFDSIDFFDFVKTSLVLREKLKFEFTKNLSDAMELIVQVGIQFGFTREDMSKLNINDILKAKKLSKSKTKQYWQTLISKEINKKQITDLLVLPPLIFNENDFEIINYYISKPNFITNKKITSTIMDLEKFKQKINRIENHVVLIENADPGYDWIFTKNPSGLITKYGGVASHMAIRCAEIGLPAAIGCGEILYEKLKLSSAIMLDCKNQEIFILEHSRKDDEVEARKILKSLGYIK